MSFFGACPSFSLLLGFKAGKNYDGELAKHLFESFVFKNSQMTVSEIKARVGVGLM